MSQNAKDKRPMLKPVIKAELSEKDKIIRIVAAAVLLVLGLIAIAYAAVSLLGNSGGYTEIKAEGIYSEFFILNYDLGASGASASSDKRRVSSVYNEALNRYCELLSSDTAYSSGANLFYINSHPETDIVVDPFLYSALERMEQSGSRLHYLGPVLERYDSVFSCDLDGYAELVDPQKNAESADFCKTAVKFVQNVDDVSLRFLGNNTVRLEISDEYEEFAYTHGIERFVDLGVFENAFVVDGIAEALAKNGMTYGAISSYDGYSRNLDERANNYSFAISGKYGDTLYPVCNASYTGKMSTVFFRSYPTSGLGSVGYYMYADGTSVHSFINTASGICTSSVPEILVASNSADCISLALSTYSIFTSSPFIPSDIEEASVVWLNGNTVCTTGTMLELSHPYSDKEVSFEISQK